MGRGKYAGGTRPSCITEAIKQETCKPKSLNELEDKDYDPEESEWVEISKRKNLKPNYQTKINWIYNNAPRYITLKRFTWFVVCK